MRSADFGFAAPLTGLLLAVSASAGAGEPTNMSDHRSMSEPMDMSMAGWLGPYPMTRESSGTSWQPDDSPMTAIHSMMGDWSVMTHGMLTGIYDDQKGPRGDSQLLATTMGMVMASRMAMGGTFGLRAMLSLDPALVGKDGYPLLLQTGETADGVTPLIDRQHPHDFFMELSTAYSRKVAANQSVFVYLALPGEPALGPPTFMHRFSGMANPETPLGHHWLDATHISFGVATLGYTVGPLKLDGSVFNAREPDQDRYDIETGKLDSQSVRLSWNPGPGWAMQVSQGWLTSPEQLEPATDIKRQTASLIHQRKIGSLVGQTTVAFGTNNHDPGTVTQAWLVDSAITAMGRTTVFGRLERLSNDELFEAPDPLAGQKFWVTKASLGAAQKVWSGKSAAVKIGAMASRHFVPDALEAAYSSDPMSYQAFIRLALTPSHKMEM